MRVAEVMTSDPIVIGPDETIQRAAELMDKVDVGALPVCEGARLVGLVTGRDLADRAAAARCAPEMTPVSRVMTSAVRWATTEDDPRAAELLMSDLQVRRLPVMDCDRHLVGIVSLNDLAAAARAAEAAEAAEATG